MSDPKTSPIRDQLLRESQEMASHALASGLQVPPPVLQAVDRFTSVRGHPSEEELTALASAHERLARLVAPATPRALVLFAEQSGETGWMRRLGPVRLVRQMMVVALLSLAFFILLNTAHAWVDELGDFPARDLLTREFLWLAAAALGASFAMLFQVNDFIVNRNYDPKYEPSYWIKFILGAIAGFILAALIPVESMVSGGEAAQPAGGASSTHDIATALAKPTLALLGGYSASAVYRILNRLITAVESVFRGDPREEMAMREQAVAAQHSQESAQSRISVASQLVELRHQIAAGSSPEEISRRVSAIVGSLLPGTEEGEGQDAPARKIPVPSLVDETGTIATAPTAAADAEAGEEPASTAPAESSAPTP